MLGWWKVPLPRHYGLAEPVRAAVMVGGALGREKRFLALGPYYNGP